MYLLGYDIGSSSVKASLVNSETGKCVASVFYLRQSRDYSCASRLGRTETGNVVGKPEACN